MGTVYSRPATLPLSTNDHRPFQYVQRRTEIFLYGKRAQPRATSCCISDRAAAVTSGHLIPPCKHIHFSRFKAPCSMVIPTKNAGLKHSVASHPCEGAGDRLRWRGPFIIWVPVSESEDVARQTGFIKHQTSNSKLQTTFSRPSRAGQFPGPGLSGGVSKLPALPVWDWLPILKGQCQYYIYANVDPCFDTLFDTLFLIPIGIAFFFLFIL